jgi:hypothetical protein
VTKAEEICRKISPSLTPEFYEGKRDVADFEDLLQRLKDRSDITKDEYQYVRKNLYKREDLKEIQATILRAKDDIFESVGMSTIIHEMDRYSRGLSKSGFPEYYDIMQKLEEWAERADSA